MPRGKEVDDMEGQRVVEWGRRDHDRSKRRRLISALAPFFLVIVPLALRRLSAALDRAPGLPRAYNDALCPPLARLTGGAGLILGASAAGVQLTRGRGTPVPVVPTQELVTDRPYRLTRNPMILGTALHYLSVAVDEGSLSGGAIVLGITGALLGYSRSVEEAELLARFGEAYEQYRAETPFLVPRRPRRTLAPGL